MGFLEHLRKATPEIQESEACPCDGERPAQDIATSLRQAIRKAQYWGDLEAVMAQIPALVKAGHLSLEQSDHLGALANREARTLPEHADQLRLRTLFQGGPVHRCHSRVLGEDVLFVADSVTVPPGNTLVVYREAELRLMVGKSRGEVQAVHEIKKMFDGEVTESEESEPTLWASDLLPPQEEQGPAAVARKDSDSTVKPNNLT